MNYRSSAVAMLIAFAFLPTANAASDPQRIIHTVTIDEFAEQTLHTRNVLDWVKRHSPSSFAPLGYGKVLVERSASTLQRVSAPDSTTNSDFPGRLPDSGAPGEIYKVENSLPDGSMQMWEFKWVQSSTGHGGGWEIIAYLYRKGNDPLNPQ